MNLLKFNNFYLVGIKGVAMTSLAQILIDAKKNVTGSDVAQDFITANTLDQLKIIINKGFKKKLPINTECVIYTAAHQGKKNPQVQEAIAKKILVVSQAQAVAEFFNQKLGIAACGVGGKSTVSAMITWILEKNQQNPSFSVGVGSITGLKKTGQWNQTSKYFVIEADEYVIDTELTTTHKQLIPRFSFLQPTIIICTNLKYDHPDVYQNFDQTKKAFGDFFTNLKTNGILIINYQDKKMIDSLPQFIQYKPKMMTFGNNQQATIDLKQYHSTAGRTQSKFSLNNKEYQLTLHIPGKYNVLNALASILASMQLGIQPQQAAAALASFKSTKRRFEFIKEKRGITYYDDYAHHPHEIKAAIQALNEWYPHQKKVIAFQAHTYSRTTQLFEQFVDAFEQAQEVVMIDIFSSAREKKDNAVSSTKLTKAIFKKFGILAQNLKTLQQLATYCKNNLSAGDVMLTLGAGDIYQVHELI